MASTAMAAPGSLGQAGLEAGRRCVVCGEGTPRPVLTLPEVPVLSTEYHADRAAALGAPRGRLALSVCEHCGLVWNNAFDPALVDYTPDYENSQHFSPAFRSYVAALAGDLATRHDLAGRTVVDIGCGKGEFLAELVGAVDCRAVGFDPTFAGEVADDRIVVRREYYDRETAAGLDADLVLARHVVEHLADPVGFLADLRRAAGSASVYFEVPNAEHVFSDDGMWDLIYQHVGYFPRPALHRALRRAGHEVDDLQVSFHGQFLGIHGHPVADPDAPLEPPDQAAVQAFVRQVDTYAQRLRARLDEWRDRLRDRSGETVLWGAGAKGVTFLNLVDGAEAIDHVVDVNPRKTGRFVPGTGHHIVPPSTLRGRAVANVIVMNQAYADEIRAELHAMDLDPVLDVA